jgi:hypothetical protein
MSTLSVEIVKTVEEHVAHTLYTVEWFATAIPVSHTKMHKEGVRRGLCGCKD